MVLRVKCTLFRTLLTDSIDYALAPPKHICDTLSHLVIDKESILYPQAHSLRGGDMTIFHFCMISLQIVTTPSLFT
jgi:hypothetical protein